MDTIGVAALIVAVLGALGHFLKDSHIQKCKACCIESDCRDKNRSQPSTPAASASVLQPEINSTGC